MSNKSNNQVLITECIEQEFKESSFFPGHDDPKIKTQKEKFFELFSSSLILKTYDISNDDIEQGIIGGGGDGGADSLYILLDGEVVKDDIEITDDVIKRNSQIDFFIIQSKFQNGFKEDVVDKFKTLSSNLLDMTKDMSKFSKRYTEKTIAIFGQFCELVKLSVRKSPAIHFHYLYAAIADEIHPNVLQKKRRTD